MHEAFYAIRLIRGNHYDFECMTCFKNYLLIGTKSGQILFYEITPPVSCYSPVFIPPIEPQPNPSLQCKVEFVPSNNCFPDGLFSSGLPAFNVRLCATHNVYKKRILQLQAVQEFGFFLALTEVQLAAHNFSNRQLISVVPNSKNATCFAIAFQSSTLEFEKQTHLNGIYRRLKEPQSYTQETVLLPAKASAGGGGSRFSLKLSLCVCVKKKLHFFCWVPSKRAFVLPSEYDDASLAFWPAEFSIPEPAKSVQFCGADGLMIALRTEYMRLNLRTLDCVKISVISKMASTLMIPLPYCLDPVPFTPVGPPSAITISSLSPLSTAQAPETSFAERTKSGVFSKWLTGGAAPFAFAADEHFYTLLPGEIDVKPSALNKWSDIAQCIHVFPPYLLAGLPKCLEVWSLEPCTQVQSLVIPQIRSMCSNDQGWLYASAAASVYPNVDDSQSCVTPEGTRSPIMAHGSDVWLLLSPSRLQCVQKLTQEREFEMALRVASYAGISGQQAITTNPIGALFAFHLFDTKRNFEGAFQLFYKLKTDPILVLGLCPGLLSPQDATHLDYPSPPRALSDSEKSVLFECLIAFLVRWRNHLRSSRPVDSGASDFLQQEVAVSSIVRYQELKRSRGSLLQVVDTSLLKSYQVTNVARIGPLLRHENYCSIEVAEKILKMNNLSKDLVSLYQVRGLHREALQCLASGGEFSAQDIVNYFKQLPNAPFDLVVEFGQSILTQHPRAWMSIFTVWERQIRQGASVSKKDVYNSMASYRDKAMRYLEREAPHLVIPFLECVLFSPCGCKDSDEEEEAVDALEILHEQENEAEATCIHEPNFCSTPEHPRASPRVSVVASFSKGDSLRSLSSPWVVVSSNPALTNGESKAWECTCLWPFPKHCHVHRRGETCRICRRTSGDDGVTDVEVTIWRERTEPKGIPDVCPPPPGFSPHVELHDRYVRALLQQIQQNVWDRPMPPRVEDEEPGDGMVARLRGRLLAFLSAYDVPLSAEDLLSHFPYDGCFEERTVLLARLRRHRQALTMWVHLLDSWNKALEHCAWVQTQVGNQNATAQESKMTVGIEKGSAVEAPGEIYTTLIDVCLNPLEPIALGIILPYATVDASRSGGGSDLGIRFQPRMDRALEVMLRFGDLVDVIKVLHLIPDDVSIKVLADFLKPALQRQARLDTLLAMYGSAVAREQVGAVAVRVATTAALAFKVTPGSRCGVCRGHIGSAAFVRYPESGDLLHYGCCRDLPPLDSVSPALHQL